MSNRYLKENNRLIKVDTKTGKKKFVSSWQNEDKLKRTVDTLNINTKIKAKQNKSSGFGKVVVDDKQKIDYDLWRKRNPSAQKRYF